MAEISAAVQTVVRRMESHPEEFYGEGTKWKFIYKEKFRDVLTEAEKGALHEALRELRRNEFAAEVVSTVLADEVKLQKAAAYEQQKGLFEKYKTP